MCQSGPGGRASSCARSWVAATWFCRLCSCAMRSETLTDSRASSRSAWTTCPGKLPSVNGSRDFRAVSKPARRGAACLQRGEAAARAGRVPGFAVGRRYRHYAPKPISSATHLAVGGLYQRQRDRPAAAAHVLPDELPVAPAAVLEPLHLSPRARNLRGGATAQALVQHRQLIQQPSTPLWFRLAALARPLRPLRVCHSVCAPAARSRGGDQAPSRASTAHAHTPQHGCWGERRHASGEARTHWPHHPRWRSLQPSAQTMTRLLVGMLRRARRLLAEANARGSEGGAQVGGGVTAAGPTVASASDAAHALLRAVQAVQRQHAALALFAASRCD